MLLLLLLLLLLWYLLDDWYMMVSLFLPLSFVDCRGHALTMLLSFLQDSSCFLSSLDLSRNPRLFSSTICRSIGLNKASITPRTLSGMNSPNGTKNSFNSNVDCSLECLKALCSARSLRWVFLFWNITMLPLHDEEFHRNLTLQHCNLTTEMHEVICDQLSRSQGKCSINYVDLSGNHVNGALLSNFLSKFFYFDTHCCCDC